MLVVCMFKHPLFLFELVYMCAGILLFFFSFFFFIFHYFSAICEPLEQCNFKNAFLLVLNKWINYAFKQCAHGHTHLIQKKKYRWKKIERGTMQLISSLQLETANMWEHKNIIKKEQRDAKTHQTHQTHFCIASLTAAHDFFLFLAYVRSCTPGLFVRSYYMHKS